MNLGEWKHFSNYRIRKMRFSEGPYAVEVKIRDMRSRNRPPYARAVMLMWETGRNPGYKQNVCLGEKEFSWRKIFGILRHEIKMDTSLRYRRIHAKLSEGKIKYDGSDSVRKIK